MSPRHFSRQAYPRMARLEDEGLTQVFTTFTSIIGLGRYFSNNPAPTMSNSIIEDPDLAGDHKVDHSSLYK